MVARVLLGRRGSAHGLWVSKPGKNVLTATGDDLLFSTDTNMFQIVSTGQVSVSNGGSGTIYHPNMGFIPTVLLMPDCQFSGNPTEVPAPMAWLSSQTNTRSTVRVSGFSSYFGYTGVVGYAVLRTPALG